MLLRSQGSSIRNHVFQEDLILENQYNYVVKNQLDTIARFDAEDDYDKIKKEYLERKKKSRS